MRGTFTGRQSIGLMVFSLLSPLVLWGCGDESTSPPPRPDAMTIVDMAGQLDELDAAAPDAAIADDATVEVDAAAELDTSVTLTDMDATEFDAQVEVDAAVVPTVDAEVQMQPDAELEADAVVDADAEMEADAGNSMTVLGCRLGDAWTVFIRSIPPAGMGCRQDGGSGQGDVTHRLVVDNPSGGPNSLTPYVVRPDQSARPFSETGADSVSLEATLMEDDGTCILIGSASLGVNFPPDGSCGNRPTEVRMTYEYNLRATNGIVDGTGFVISEYGAFPITGNNDPATVEPCRAPCSEPLTISGTVEAP